MKSTQHTRTQSLKERLLNRKLPKVLRDNLSLSPPLNYDVTMLNHRRCGGEGEILSKEDGSVCGRDKEEEDDVDTRKTTPTSSSTTITR